MDTGKKNERCRLGINLRVPPTFPNLWKWSWSYLPRDLENGKFKPVNLSINKMGKSIDTVSTYLVSLRHLKS